MPAPGAVALVGTTKTRVLKATVAYQQGCSKAGTRGTAIFKGFLEGGDFGNPSERSERALKGSGLTGK